MASLQFDNPVFAKFAFYAGIVLVKMMIMSVLTAIQRFKKMVFANPEDTASHNQRTGHDLKPILNDPDVERVRRCHQNDIENIIPFVLVGFLYVLSGPALSTAVLHFRIFAGFRIFHMFAYLIPIPQPARALAFFAGYLATFSMAYHVITSASM